MGNRINLYAVIPTCFKILGQALNFAKISYVAQLIFNVEVIHSHRCCLLTVLHKMMHNITSEFSILYPGNLGLPIYILGRLISKGDLKKTVNDFLLDRKYLSEDALY